MDLVNCVYLDWLCFDVGSLELMVVEVRSRQLRLFQRRVAHLHSTKASQVAELHVITIRLEHRLELTLYYTFTPHKYLLSFSI